jgi:Domain of unknown function (DUF2017)
MAGRSRVVKRRRGGDFELRLPEVERDVLRSLPEQLRQLLEDRDPSTVRLFPPAYPDDADHQAEYEELVRDDLQAGRLTALAVVERTIDARRVTEEELAAWLSALNDLRLVMGTRLEIVVDGDGEDVSEDDPRAPAFGLYYYLGWLVSEIVDALAADLDPEGTEQV